ncbi:zinc metalloproteinase nas-13-like [Paramacrobiotus metropolitanus]|uniref:zinc metalloproteinase nas-13-like n=1 Tax=Paramacrobiotus metropolitanus TaxID=2943436 RepID=UPI00244608BF|nr:zinc metalloproteinase nas-13-like [Paramacrobiotus metropolitanus]
MRIISHRTGNCLNFVQRTTEEDYISFQKGLQCMSNIGRIGGKQAVTYSPACLKQHGDVQHELLHVLGFFHEHSRADRDEYVKIIWDNIAKSDRDQFAKHENGNTYGFSYDYESVMHYKHNAFAKDSAIPNIVPTSRKSKIGQSRDLSPLDVVRIHRRFRCAIAHPKQFACDLSGSEKPSNYPVCPIAQARREDPCESGNSIEDDGENSESFTTSESFPQFSVEPMSAEQCGHQCTANCNDPELTAATCTSFQGLTINCSTQVSAAEIRQISAGLSKPPIRPIAVDLYDGDYIVFESFQTVRQQVVTTAIRNCISSRTVQKLAALRFSNLLQLELKHCHGLEIKRTDFGQSIKITVITFEDTTIKTLEKGTFIDLPSSILRVGHAQHARFREDHS